MKKIIYTLILALCGNYLQAQLPGLTWSRAYGGSGLDYATAVIATNDGGCIVAGYSGSDDGDITGHHSLYLYYDFWIIRLNAAGDIVWEKSIGGDQSDYAYSMMWVNDKIWVAGSTASSATGDLTDTSMGGLDMLVAVLNPETGELLNIYQYGAEADDVIQDMNYGDNAGNYINLCGYSYSHEGEFSENNSGIYYSDAMRYAVDLNGNFMSIDLWGSYANERLIGAYTPSVIPYPQVWGWTNGLDGDIECNSGASNIYEFSDLNSHTCLGGNVSETADDILFTDDLSKGVYIAGNTSSTDGAIYGTYPGEGPLLIKIPYDADSIQYIAPDGSYLNHAQGISFFGSDRVVVCGYTASTDGDFSANTGYSGLLFDANIYTLGGMQTYFYGGNDADEFYAVTQSSDDGLFAVGNTLSTDIANYHDGPDFWVVKLGGSSNSVINSVATNNLNVYPNPASDIINVQIPDELKSAQIKLLNAQGNILKTIPSQNNPLVQINIKNYPEGIYFLQISNDEKNYFSKFIITH